MRAGFALALVAVLLTVNTATANNKKPFGGIFSGDPIVEAAQKGALEDAKAALVDGASANARAPDGTPVLILAVQAGSTELFDLLLANGARTDARGNDEATALTTAATIGNTEIVILLLDTCADIDSPG